MATIYKVKVVSDWINYTEQQLQKMLEDTIKDKEREKGNTIRIVEVKRE